MFVAFFLSGEKGGSESLGGGLARRGLEGEVEGGNRTRGTDLETYPPPADGRTTRAASSV